MGRIWDRFISREDLEVYQAAGYGARSVAGSRPVLLVVDVNYNFVGERPEPILESIAKYRNSCSEEGWRAVGAIRRLLSSAREHGVPVVYTTQPSEANTITAGAWASKNSRVLDNPEQEVAGARIVEEIAPQPGDVVIRKEKPSAFFSTPLASYLNQFQADTVVVVGGTTSGCVRATVVDAFSLNYSVLVVEDGCFDRVAVSHAVNLFELNAKYADVVSLDDAVAYLERARVLV
jgi:maleamate amidohydrolase